MRAASVILGLAIAPSLPGCAAPRVDAAPPAEGVDVARRRRERPDMSVEPQNPSPGKPRRGDKRADARP